jgi:hypothetical protein
MALTEERLQKARAWIDEHTNDAPGQLAAMMRASGEEFLGEVSPLSEAEIVYSPGEGQWCVREVCLHVIDAIGKVGGLVPILASGTAPDWPKPRPGVLAKDPGDFNQVLAALQKTFETATNASESLDGSPDTTALYEHPYFGPLNSRQWMAFNVLHTKAHIGQVKRVKAALKTEKLGA